jgi:hypothetical protein
MSINDINVPDNLMSNVENKLRNHIQAKKKRRGIYAASIALILALGIPASALAYNNYINSIPYSQEVDLARQNNTATKLDATFKYKDVEFKFKEAVADETGMVVLYEVSNPRYSIDSISLKDIETNAPESWGYTLPDNDDTKTEKAFFTEVRGSTFVQMKNNPITIKIDKINDSSKNKDIDVNWSLKLQLPIREVKTIPINKEYKLNIGTMKLRSLNMSVLKTYIDYEFIPNDKSILSFSPTFSYRIDKAGFLFSNSILDSEHLINFSGEASEFQPLYYSAPKEIGITLIGGSIRYEYNDYKEYCIDKTKLPMEFNFKGEKGRIVSAKEKDNSVEYIFEFDKIDRAYSYLGPRFEKSTRISTKYEEVKFNNQEVIDNLYSNLSKKIPNFEKIFTTYNFNKGAVTLQVEAPKETSDKFTIADADKNILFNLDEIIVKP